MMDEKSKEVITLFEEILADLFHTTRAQTKTGKTQLVSLLRKFSNKGKVKIFKSRKSGSRSAKKSNLAKSSHSSSHSSNGSVFGSTHVSSPRKWGDYTTSEESLQPVMVTKITPNSDGRIQQMALDIEKLTKSLEDKEAQISTLMHRLEVQSPFMEDSPKTASSSRTKNPEIQEHQQKQDIHDRMVVQNVLRDTTQLSVGSLSVQQLQHMIADTIRAQYGGSPQSSLVYAKTYSRRIEEMRMPLGYQPPKFQCFDGKGNTKQYVAHFIETCNNAGTYNDTMAKQFVRSLRDTSFECTKQTVSLPELARTKRSKEELVKEYIERWKNFVLNCKKYISEASSIDMCVQGMHWGLLYNLQANMSHSFEELATRAHDLEIHIARHRSYLPSDVRDKKYPKKEIKRDGKAGKPKEAMTIFTVPTKITFQKSGSNLGPKPKPELRPSKVQVQRKGLLTLKELEEK
ncbi:Ribonuclease H [Abeliophyllum distichum]|uniref:Ribonuclease H n=1 Tax=Abeliophyllum distichum TaxID=126358 RepID=A0ABD1SC05_9LAMI